MSTGLEIYKCHQIYTTLRVYQDTFCLCSFGVHILFQGGEIYIPYLSLQTYSNQSYNDYISFDLPGTF